MNLTHTFLIASRPLNTMSFSAAVTNQSLYLNGPGGEAGNGYPLARRGYITALHLWDGTTYRYDTDEIAFQMGDTLAVYCQNAGSDFDVKVRLERQHYRAAGDRRTVQYNALRHRRIPTLPRITLLRFTFQVSHFKFSFMSFTTSILVKTHLLTSPFPEQVIRNFPVSFSGTHARGAAAS